MTATSNILQRLHAVMQEVDYIQKDPKKQGMQYSYVSHDKVTGLVRPVLVKHGVIYYPQDMECRQDGNRTEVRMCIRFANIDDKTDYIDVQTLGYGIDSQDKGPGKAISYAVKYALLKALGLETGDDPDNDSIAHEPKPAPAKAPTYDRNPIVEEAYKAMDIWLNNIGNTGTVEDLAEFWKENQKTIKALPADWLKELTAKKDKVKTTLLNKVAA